MRRLLPLGLRKAMQLNPNRRVCVCGGKPSEEAQIAPERHCREDTARSGSAKRSQRSKGISLCSCRTPRNRRPAERRAAQGSALIPRWQLHGVEARRASPGFCRLGSFHPRSPRLFRVGGFQMPFKTKQPLHGVESVWRVGRRAKASRLQTLPVLTASGAGCRRRRHLGTLRFPRAFPC